MSKANSLSAADLALPFACILVISTLFTAGLFPFNAFPRNQVTWLPTGKGLHFGDHGVVFAKGPVTPVRPKRDSSCTLSIRLQPDTAWRGASGTLLGIYTPENRSQFRLMQWRDVLMMRRDYRDAENHSKANQLDLDHAFPADEPVSFTITSGAGGSVVYRNGTRAAGITRLGLSCEDFAGQLVLGDSAVIDNAWPGNILDLAIYDRELTPEEIAGKYASWHGNQTVEESGGDPHVVARYAFSEGRGQIVHGEPRSAPDLYIPEMFKVPHKKMLMWPWEESHDKLELRDILINIFGFVPFGFVFVAYLNWNRNVSHAMIVTILCGAAISLTIEILQEYIPGRDSGILDVFTNTLGTFLGVLLFRWAPAQNLTRKLLDNLRSGGQISEN
jgi:VanZ like family/Concanavalin A-like lectin/glucanases superfamily